jgi:hypothetical protein
MSTMSTPLVLTLLACDGSDGPDTDPRFPEPVVTIGDPPEPEPPFEFDYDTDLDGVPDSEDCAPEDPSVYPGAPELCNGLDENCDGQPDPVSERDEDGDGWMWCEECDDEDGQSHPGAPDPHGDGVDTDCDGTDGQGTPLSGPLRVGEIDDRTVGLALAAGDVDGDGCAELLIGEPGGYANGSTDDAATLGTGCWPWTGTLLPREGNHTYLGYNVDLAPGLVVVHEWGWSGFRGRAQVFDESFGPEAEPLLEVLGGGPNHRWVSSLAVLGEPAEWLLIGRQGGLDDNSAFQLVDINRRGTIDFELDEPDFFMETNTPNYHVSLHPADVGDRDGDGETDLGVVGEMGARPGRFFPQVTGGHVDDAPEIWADPNPGWFADQLVRSGGDLDGDGRSDAVLSSLFADGEQPETGRAFLVPWKGSGEWDLEVDAPTRLDGELPGDWFGADSEVTDLDGDGQSDLVISASGSWNIAELPGKVTVFRGPLAPGVLTTADAALVWVGEQRGDTAGAALATGDFDGSGRGDIAIGAPFADRDGLTDAGAVYVLIDPL